MMEVREDKGGGGGGGGGGGVQLHVDDIPQGSAMEVLREAIYPTLMVA